MSSFRRTAAMVALLALAAPLGLPAGQAQSYDDLVALFTEWREFQRPRFEKGVPDYTPAAMKEQWEKLPEMQARLAAFDVDGWPVGQQVDYHLVRAEMNGLEFDHRVLRPWSRDPNFYATVVDSQSDTPLKEGPIMDGHIELWRLEFPLDDAGAARLQTQIEAIPAVLDQAKSNLVEDARDLWRTGVRTHQGQQAVLEDLGKTLAAHHPSLVPGEERAREAVASFQAWLEQELPEKKAPSGVGISNYNWYMRNVHLVPFTWEDELRIMQRELQRATAHLALEEHNNRHLPPLRPVTTAEEWKRFSNDSLTEYMRFIEDNEIITVEDYMDQALRERLSGFVPAEGRHFFAQVDARDPLVLRCHGSHWWDTARINQDPHPSPIRSVPLLYNIWDSRSEGLSTATEEMMMSAGLFNEKPRSRELVYIMVAQRAARAIAGLRVHSREYDLDMARHFASAWTPRGWMKEDGGLNWGEQQLYLEQPGYGTSYITGKVLIEQLLAERAHRQGDEFTLKGFMDELAASGVIPVSLIRWELTGHKDEILN